MEAATHLRPRLIASLVAAVLGALVMSLVPVVSDVAEYTQWFNTGAPEGVEPIFAVLPDVFHDIGRFPAFLALYAAVLCGVVTYSLLTDAFNGLSHVDAMLVGGAALYLLSPYFLFNQALLIRQSMASLLTVGFVFSQFGWLGSLILAIGFHASGFLLIVFRRSVLFAAVLATVGFFVLGGDLEAAEISRKINFVNQVVGDENNLTGLSLIRFVAGVALTSVLMFSRDKRVRTLGFVLIGFSLVTPLVASSGIFLTRMNFLVFYWSPILIALGLSKERDRFGACRTASAAAVFLIGMYTAVASFVNLDRVIMDH